MRGKDHPVPNAKYTHRITPAYAGKSIHATLDAPPEQDHPRLCGEKVLFHIVRIKRKGSPPPMRGKGRVCCRRSSAGRITPAYAGKRQLSAFPLKFVWDHPRLCGEKAAGLTVSPARTGITPAYAGKSEAPS